VVESGKSSNVTVISDRAGNRAAVESRASSRNRFAFIGKALPLLRCKYTKWVA
jgi:hypothetical protein